MKVAPGLVGGNFTVQAGHISQRTGGWFLGEEGGARNPLFGDFTLRSIRTQLRQIVGSMVDNGDGDDSYNQLSLIGIKSDTDGRLTFTQSDFETALNADSSAVKDLFSFGSVGIAERIYTTIDGFTDSVDGLIKARTDSFDDRIRRMDRQIEQKELRLEQFEERQRQRFAALEAPIGQLQAQGDALSALQFPSFS